MIKTRLEAHLARQATNYRAPINVGEKLALTIRYLATGESYSSLSCQFRVGRSTISKFIPEVCRAIQDEFTREYLKCPTTPDEWKELERENSGSDGIFHMPWELWMGSMWPRRSPRTLEPSTTTTGASFPL